jgi:hypothetical protein
VNEYRKLVTKWDLMQVLFGKGTAYIVVGDIQGILATIERESGDGRHFLLTVNTECGGLQEVYWKSAD